MLRRQVRRFLTALLLPVLMLGLLSPPSRADSEGGGPETYWGLADAITDADVVTVDGKRTPSPR